MQDLPSLETFTSIAEFGKNNLLVDNQFRQYK